MSYFWNYRAYFASFCFHGMALNNLWRIKKKIQSKLFRETIEMFTVLQWEVLASLWFVLHYAEDSTYSSEYQNAVVDKILSGIEHRG